MVAFGDFFIDFVCLFTFFLSFAEVKIAGMSTEYVNQMIQRVKGSGMPNT